MIKREDALRAVSEGKPITAELHPAIIVTAMTLLDEGQNDTAYALLKAAEALDPDHAELQAGLAGVEADYGRRDVAVRHTLRSLELNITAWWHPLHQLARMDPKRPRLLEALEDGLDKASAAGEHELAVRQTLQHAVAMVKHATGDYEGAYAAYTKTNRARVAAESIPLLRKDLLAMGRLNPWESLRAGLGPEADGPTWVFIVGMPRTGSTLVEQVLVAGDPHGTLTLGEDAGLVSIAGRAGEYGPKRMRESGAAYTQWALDKLSHSQARGCNLDKHSPPAIILNKSPGNYAFLGLMRLIWGDRVKVIHTVRSPQATLVSCWRQNFALAGLNWSCDWNAATNAYQHYRDFMAMWVEVLPEIEVLNVSYEALVSSWEPQVDRIWAFVHGSDLAPSSAMEPWKHNIGHAVQTASNLQVREPVHKGAIDHWRNYEPWLPQEVLDIQGFALDQS